MVSGFIWASTEWREPGLPGLIVAFPVTALAGALMVSPFSYPSFKNFDLRKPVRFVWLVMAVLGLRRDRRRSSRALAAVLRQLCAVGAAAVDAGGALRRRQRVDRGAELSGGRCARAASQYLQALGIDALAAAPPARGAASAAAAIPRAIAPRPRAAAESRTEMGSARGRSRGCVRCGLHATRTQTVFGVGDRRAELLVVGEAPGAEEDRQGEPFVGRAGQLLNSMLRAMGAPRETVFIANVLKCRPPGNRDPTPEEVALLPALPAAADRAADAAPDAGGRAHRGAEPAGHRHAHRQAARQPCTASARSGTPLVVTYHPAYLLRSPTEKRKAWDDLRCAQQRARAPARQRTPAA